MRPGFSIQKHAGSRGAAPVGGVDHFYFFHHIFFLAESIKCFSTNFFRNFKSIHIYMKDTECAEMNELIFRFLGFLVFEIWSFFYKNWSTFQWILSTKSTITQKIKIEKIGKFISHSFQLIALLFCKFDHFWKTLFFGW